MSKEQDDHCGPLSVGKLLSHIGKYSRTHFKERLEPIGIDGSTFGTMMYLFRQDNRTEREIADHLRVDKATTTRTIHKLEELGYVERSKDLNDRRAYRIILTDKALGIKKEMLKARNEWIDIVLRDFTTEDRETLLDLLYRMERNLLRSTGKGDVN